MPAKPARLLKLLRREQNEESAQATTGAYLNVSDRGVRKPDAVMRSICEVCGSLFVEAEVFRSVIIAHVLYYLTETGQLFHGVLTAFNQTSEHLA